MLQERLLERIRHIEENPSYRGSTDPNRIVASILLHLQKILNTRQGSAQIDEFYGVPDFTDLAANFSSESIRDLIRSIKSCVGKYEPRLTSVLIEAEEPGDRSLELRFKISGRLAVDEHNSLPVAFETVVDPNGRIQINQ